MTDKLSKFEFKPEDFKEDKYEILSYEAMADITNAKISPLLDRLNELEAMIENAPTVYGHVKKGVPNWWGPHEDNIFNDTHKAKLVMIEEIKSEELPMLPGNPTLRFTKNDWGDTWDDKPTKPMSPERTEEIRQVIEDIK